MRVSSYLLYRGLTCESPVQQPIPFPGDLELLHSNRWHAPRPAPSYTLPQFARPRCSRLLQDEPMTRTSCLLRGYSASHVGNRVTVCHVGCIKKRHLAGHVKPAIQVPIRRFTRARQTLRSVSSNPNIEVSSSPRMMRDWLFL